MEKAEDIMEADKAAEIRANVDDTMIFEEENEPQEFAEDKLEPMDDNLVCPICLDIFFNPICTMWGHTFCKVCLTEDFQKWPLCSEPWFVADANINVTLRGVLEKYFPKRTQKRKYYHDLRIKQLEEEMKEKDYLTDIPVFFIMGNVTPGSLDFFRVFEQRYHDMVNLIMQRDRKFVIIRKRQEKLGYVVKIEEYRRVMDNRTIIKIKSVDRFEAEEYFIPEDRANIYPEGQEQLWFAKGNIVRDKYPEFEDAKEKEEYFKELKAKANQVYKEVFEKIEERRNKISRRNLGWIQIRYKFPSMVSSKNIEEYITNVGLTALNFFHYGDSNTEKVRLIFEGTPKERLEFSLSKLKNTPMDQKIFWFEEDVQMKKGWRGLIVLILLIFSLIFIKYIKDIPMYNFS